MAKPAPATHRFASFDGVELACHTFGQGRPVVLLHGLFSSAEMNWVRFGHAARLVEAGFEAIMPDLRAHGDSAAPHDPAAYPPHVLLRDVEAVVGHFDLVDFALVGFSLGARIAVSAAPGLAPRRLVLAGMGLESLSNWDERVEFFVDAIDRFVTVRQGDPAYFAVQFMKTMKIDRIAARLLLTRGIDGPSGDLAALTMPTLVVAGDKDRDNGSPQALAEALPNARFEEVPGTHMSSVTEPALGEAIARFLAVD